MVDVEFYVVAHTVSKMLLVLHNLMQQGFLENE